jgi:hypothetical protein
LGSGIALTGVCGLVAAALFWAFLPHRNAAH